MDNTQKTKSNIGLRECLIIFAIGFGIAAFVFLTAYLQYPSMFENKTLDEKYEFLESGRGKFGEIVEYSIDDIESCEEHNTWYYKLGMFPRKHRCIVITYVDNGKNVEKHFFSNTAGMRTMVFEGKENKICFEDGIFIRYYYVVLTPEIYNTIYTSIE